MTRDSLLGTPLKINGLTLKNRITMTPLYLGYANPDGTVSPLLLEYYREMAASGVAMVVVENSAVHASGLGSPFTLRSDHDRYLPGLRRLAQTIKDEGALAFLQINHAGRYRFMPKMIAPSAIKTGDHIPQEMTMDQIKEIVVSFAAAAKRTKEAGFDGVEIHGGTSYLIIQFLSSKTNHRTDQYGGTLKNRA
jgi:2,4-dienoyl-CoA reductase-like NADH-dependent reductase (Old Yellow Enzyme family)